MSIDTECFKEVAKLKELRVAHRDLDTMIVSMSEDPSVDQLHLRRLKRRKLYIKDNISRMVSDLIPDQPA